MPRRSERGIAVNYEYRDLGLSNTKEMLERAFRGHYAVPAFNFISIEQLNAVIDAGIAYRSPIILLVSSNLLRQLGREVTARLSQACVDRIREAKAQVSVALHLDHGRTVEQCVTAIHSGFSSVMIDGSDKDFEENIRLTAEVVRYAHAREVTVEGELGALGGTEESDGGETTVSGKYTDPEMAEEFVRRTGVDSLAVSVGTSHGLVKQKPNPDGTFPELRYDLLADLEKRLPGFPIVLHGASSIPEKCVDMINRNGGCLKQTSGIPEEQIQKVSRMNVCKVNIATDGWITALAWTRKLLAENPQAIDSRIFTLPIREHLKELYLHKIELLGSKRADTT